ncbi:GD17733 [Drosophila simulans]|uniref:GD17733 n=1 Tax=Drosophila simulans TaxID=7240 RepID=B4NSX2_DROSI|nr:GD17733 [Drosophila simulans]
MGCVLITGIVVITIRILIKFTKVTKFHINQTTDDEPTNDRNEWGHSILKAEELAPKEFATTICEGLHPHPAVHLQ